MTFYISQSKARIIKLERRNYIYQEERVLIY